MFDRIAIVVLVSSFLPACAVEDVDVDDEGVKEGESVEALKWSCERSAYNGKQLWTCGSDGNRYTCAAGKVKTSTCEIGCSPQGLGRNDLCIQSTMWNCADSAYNGRQLWTCETGALYKCMRDREGAWRSVMVQCPSGCMNNGYGRDDACSKG